MYHLKIVGKTMGTFFLIVVMVVIILTAIVAYSVESKS